jgi:hypothetical protein
MSDQTVRMKRGPAVHSPPRKAEVHRAPESRQPQPAHEEIARRAYEIWLQRGCGNGHEAEDWAQAEQELCAPGPRADAARTPATRQSS